MIAISRLLASWPPNSAGSAHRSQPGRIGAPTHLTQQVFPLLAWHPVVLEVGSGPLAPVIEEAHVVVALLERNDLGLDERIEPVERFLDVGGDREVHPCTVRAKDSTMPTGRSLVSTCVARAALAGNPSDGYGGAVVAIPLHDLSAMASISENDRFIVRASNVQLAHLLQATADAFTEARSELPSVTLSASTSIPRSVGLAGSSALVIAALRGLAAWIGHRWEPIELAELALSVERDRLGIEAGLQDRLVQAVGKPISMTFDPVSYHELVLPNTMTLFVAWNPHGSQPSDTLHRSLRRRFDGGDPLVESAMGELVAQATRARKAIELGDMLVLGDAIDRSFDLRASITEIDSTQQMLIDLGRAAGAAVNSAGSGGSVVGLTSQVDDVPALQSSYEQHGFEFLLLE